MRSLLSGALLLALSTGCVMGPRPSSHRLATEPGGSQVHLTLRPDGLALRGELLAVTDSTVVVASDGRLYQVHYATVRSSAFTPRARELWFGDGRAPDGGTRGRLARRSRYPHGITPEVLRALLNAYGQPALLAPEVGA